MNSYRIAVAAENGFSNLPEPVVVRVYCETNNQTHQDQMLVTVMSAFNTG
jgi:hypothetical protein